jgi:predicted dehydrogenase
VRRVVQAASGGAVRVVDVPVPVIGATEVLVETSVTIVSAGTERAMTTLARSVPVATARARPDLVRQVVGKARAEGVGAALRSARARLATDLPLGSSGCGRAVEVGTAVDGIRPGDLVATGGAGNHAEFQAVPGLLCARVPDGVPPDDAAFATVAAIALHGLRLAKIGPGAKVAVVGLGLIGQLAARLALASGCDVAGIDVADLPIATAAAAGVRATREAGDTTTAEVLSWTRGRGVDAVLICAAGRAGEPVVRAAALARDRAPVVIVGDVGLDLVRAPFQDKELSLRFARSYGPGRCERGYEDWGVDYPAGQVRWTAGRNFEAVLDLLAAGRLTVSDLVTHTFPVADAPAAYDLVATRREPYLAIRLHYPQAGGDSRVPRPRSETPWRPRSPALRLGTRVGWIGAGTFAGAVLLPAFRAAGFDRFVTVASAGEGSARFFADRHGFGDAAAGAAAVIADDDVDVVVIATPHATHAEFAVAALERGRHVWCEKPLALSMDELAAVEKAAARGGGVLMVGYNRRFSPAVVAARRRLADRDGPLTVVYRVAAGPVPPDHWYADRTHGGRLLGEVCHVIDTCAALAGSEVDAVSALPGRHDEALLAPDFAVAMRHADGALSSVAYSSARPLHCRQESVECLAGTRRLVIDNYSRLAVDGRTVWRGPRDSGRRAAAEAFLRMCREGRSDVTAELLASSRATLAAAVGLGTGLTTETRRGAAVVHAPRIPTSDSNK